MYHILTNWLSVESPGTKPDLRHVIKLFAFKKLKRCSCIIFFSSTLPIVFNNDMGL